MAKNKKQAGSFIGSWAFLTGVILAFIVGITGFLVEESPLRTGTTYALIILGIIVGILNITEKEVQPFLLAGVSLIITSYFGANVFIAIPWMYGILKAMLIMFVPTTIIVSIKHVFSMAKY